MWVETLDLVAVEEENIQEAIHLRIDITLLVVAEEQMQVIQEGELDLLTMTEDQHHLLVEVEAGERLEGQERVHQVVVQVMR